MSKGAPHPANYRPDIDGLRALAVLAVVGYHFFPGRVPSGFVGVDIFFVISGFLISGIILDDLAENKFSFFKFYARRVRRLFPALGLVLAFTFAVGWLVLFPDEYKAVGRHIAGGAGFISNILYWRESGYFDAEAASKPLLHLWSLGIEEQFYIFFPFLLFLLWKKGLREVFFISLILAASFIYNVHLAGKDAAADFYSPLSRFWELLSGAVLACLNRSAPDSLPRRAALKINAALLCLLYKNPDRAGAPLSHLLSALGFILIAYSLVFLRNLPVWPGHWAIFPSLGAVLILAAGTNNIFNRRLLGNRLAVAVGLISYPLYLWHWPIFSYLRILSGGMPDRATRVAAVFIAMLLAWLSYKFVERPFRFGVKFRKMKTVSLGLLMLAAFGGGLYVYVQGGLPGRGVKSPDREVGVTNDQACQAYTGMPIDISIHNGDYGYFCRYADAHGKTTVALIGDSHAWSAYFGIEKLNSSLGLNTLLLARSATQRALFVGLQAHAKNKLLVAHQKMLQYSFEVLKWPEIRYIFIFVHYVDVPSQHTNLQLTIDMLTEAGKKVFVVTDWPTLPKSGVNYTSRPYSVFFNPLTKQDQLELKRDKLSERALKMRYFKLLHSLKNAVIIDGTWDAFCPDDQCQVFSKTGQRQLMYNDNNHLTNAGSEFLAEKVLAPYLKELAAN